MVKTNSNKEHQRAVEFVLGSVKSKYADAKITSPNADITFTKEDGKTIKLAVVKMRKENSGKPFSAVSLTKWKLAVADANKFFFVVAYYAKEDDNPTLYFYTVSDFWKMSSEPVNKLYCHLTVDSQPNGLSIVEDGNSDDVTAIAKCVDLWGKFKTEFSETKKEF